MPTRKNSGTASRATIVIALPSITGCWCIAKRIRTVSPNAKAKPMTMNMAARYQPGARSFGGSGTRVRTGRCATGSGASVAIGGSPSSLFASESSFPLLCHASQEGDERLDLAGAQRLCEVRGHHPGPIAGRYVCVRVDDRRVDALVEREPADLLGRGGGAVRLQPLVEIGADGSGCAGGGQRVAGAAASGSEEDR